MANQSLEIGLSFNFEVSLLDKIVAVLNVEQNYND